MKLRTVFAAALAALAMATACKKEDPAPSNGDQDRLIKVRASVYNFVKATDTAFEEGDEIGVNIFKEDEAYLYNAKFTYTLGALTPDTPHKWYKEDVEAVITAVYPHNDVVNEYAATESFTVNSDQTEFVKYQASDLLLAKTSSKPTENAVTLPFKHALSKISVTLDSKLEEEVENVWFTDLYGTVTYDPKNPFETLAAAGETGTVKAYKSGDNTWVLIVAPQENANPKLAVTTASGKQYTYTLEEAVSFGSGKLNTATVTVEETSIYTSFTPEITDWTADKELNFSQNEEDVVLPDQGGEEGGSTINPGETTTEVRIYLDNSWGWTYLWCWDNNNVQIFGNDIEWPGTKYHGEENGYYYWVVPEAYVNTTVSLLAVKNSTADEQSPNFEDVILSKDLYFALNWTEETGVVLILQDK